MRVMGEAMPVAFADAEPLASAAMQHRPWRSRVRLSSGLAAVEGFLVRAGFDRAPWLAVAFAAGIGLWFELPERSDWLALITACAGAAAAMAALLRGEGPFPYLRQAGTVIPLTVALGCLCVWAKSSLVGMPAISRPMAVSLRGVVVGREELTSQHRIRLLIDTREPGTGRPIRIRLNVPGDKDEPGLVEGATVAGRVRLMPPAPPMLPGGNEFARSAWFAGLAATGSPLSKLTVVAPASAADSFGAVKRRLAVHIQERVPGSPGGIAAAFASGDRGAIAPTDEDAMRDAGLTHLLSVSGLHVSAVVGAAYFLAIRLLALWPWLTLRVRLPTLGAAIAALAGIGYTLLTGAEVPTVRSCVGALLVLAALALGREPLSLRMLAVAALFVMLLWPEAVVGPSFQMSFASVLAIIALHGSAPARAFLTRREEPWWRRTGRHVLMLLLTGLVIELALMPVAILYFHRAGIYGSVANIIAIPLTTFVAMPLIALALFLDIVGLGAPVWWLAAKSLSFLLLLAHFTASQPGAVTHLPSGPLSAYVGFAAGALWLALWRGRVRLWGFVPVAIALLVILLAPMPDIVVSGDGRHVGLTDPAKNRLILLRLGKEGSYARQTLLEISGITGEASALDQWPGARCNQDFCAVDFDRAGRVWHLLLGRGQDPVAERSLAAACERVDIVVSDRRLPRSCHPHWLKADRQFLEQSGGLAIDLGSRNIHTVAEDEGLHGWWRPPPPRVFNGAAGQRPEASPSTSRSSTPTDVSPSQAQAQAQASRVS